MDYNNATSTSLPTTLLSLATSTMNRLLILDMELDVSYNESAHETVVHFDKDPESPTVKWGWLEYLVFAMLVPFAVGMVALVFFLSKRHERHKRAKREGEK